MLHRQYVIFDKYCITLWPEETTATTSKEGNIQRKRLGYLSEAATSGPSVTHYACSIIWLQHTVHYQFSLFFLKLNTGPTVELFLPGTSRNVCGLQAWGRDHWHGQSVDCQPMLTAKKFSPALPGQNRSPNYACAQPHTLPSPTACQVYCYFCKVTNILICQRK